MNTLFQDFQCLADLISYGIYRQSQFISNLLILETVTLAHYKNLSTLLREAVDCSPKTRLCLRTLLSIVIIYDSVSVVWLEGFGRYAFLAQMVKTAVAHHHI